MGDHIQPGGSPPGDGHPRSSETVESPERLLELLADEAVRRILAATTDEYLTVADIGSRCDIPTATAYRKVNNLERQELLAESVRVRPHGKNVSVYTARPIEIRMSVAQSGMREITLAASRPTYTPAARPTATDGGTKNNGRSYDSDRISSNRVWAERSTAGRGYLLEMDTNRFV